MKRSILVILLFCMSAINFGQTAGDSDTVFEENIIKLIKMTGGDKIGMQLANYIISSYTEGIKKMKPDIPERAIDVVKEETSKLLEEKIYSEGGFMDLIVDIYKKYYSPEDIKGLIKFYESELGQKVLRTLPEITQESLQIGERFTKTLTPVLEERIKKRLEEEGIELQ